MGRLYLVGSGRGQGGARQPSWTPAPFELERQPQRPGALCREIRLQGGPHQSVVDAGAAAAGVPSSLWATLALESQRCVERAAALFALPDAAITAMLGEAASEPAQLAPAGPQVPFSSRLSDYARALLQADARPVKPTLGGVVLRPSLRMLSAWSLACEEHEMPLEAWARRRLEDPPRDAAAWEASAALGGQTLAEWTVVQTARRLRSASTPAQTAG